MSIRVPLSRELSRHGRAGQSRAAELKLCCAKDGDLCDRLTINEIRLERITDAVKRKAVRKEQDLLSNVFHANFEPNDQLRSQLSLLRCVNERLWDIEDELRDYERAKGMSEFSANCSSQS